MNPSVIVWDLETVPDLAGFAAANDLVGKPEAGNKFPKQARSSLTARATVGPWTRLVRPTSVSGPKNRSSG
jgi:hypothetical protein